MVKKLGRRTKAWHSVEQLESRMLLAGVVNVTVMTPATGDTNLTTEGNLDWMHWGYPDDATRVHEKSGVAGPQIADFAVIGSGGVTSGDTPGKTFTWTDAEARLDLATDVTDPDDAVELVNGTNDGDNWAGSPPGAEKEVNAFNDVTQKYLNFLDLGSGVAVTVDDANGALPVNAVRLYTANDAEERDPASYQLEGSFDGGANWTTISQGPLALPSDRNEGGGRAIDPSGQFNQVVEFANTIIYPKYRITFPTLKNAAAANSMQIAEIELLHVPGGSATGTSDAIATGGAGNGFRFTAPAGVNMRRLNVYVAVEGGSGEFTAAMSGPGAPPVVRTLPDTNPGGPTTAVYTIDYESDFQNEMLVIDWVAQGGAAVTLSAASWTEIEAPSAPSFVTATPTGKGRVNLSWIDTSSNETGFKIERATAAGGPYDTVATTGPDAQQFVDSGLSENTTYYFKVSAVNGVGSTAAAGDPASVTTARIPATGITARYYADANSASHFDPNALRLTRLEPNIAANWRDGSPNPLVPGNLFSSRWEGTYIADYTGETTFFTGTDDGGRFFIDLNGNGTFDYDAAAADFNPTTPDGELVVNAWVDQGLGFDGANNGRGIVVSLVAGERYLIRFDQYENGGDAAAFLYVQGPVGQAIVVPSESLVPLEATPPTITGLAIDGPLPSTAAYTPAFHVVVRFSEAVLGVDEQDFKFEDLFGSQLGREIFNVSYDSASNTAVFTFEEHPETKLPDGNYTLLVDANGISDAAGNPLDGDNDGTPGGNATVPFYVLQGDTQSAFDGTPKPDRVINFVDYQILSRNFGMSNPTHGEGDYNHDGVIDNNDFILLLTRFGQTQSAPAAPVAGARPRLPAARSAPKPARKALPSAVKAEPVAILKPIVRAAANIFATRNVRAKDLLA